MLGWLNQRAVLTEQGDKNRAMLQRSGHLIEDATISDKDIPLVVNAWMYATYSSEPRKHDIKKSFNVLLRKLTGPVATQLPEIKVQSRQKPKMVIAHERFITPHAMFRCYAPLIRGLGRYFELIAVARKIKLMRVECALYEDYQDIQRKKGPDRRSRVA